MMTVSLWLNIYVTFVCKKKINKICKENYKNKPVEVSVNSFVLVETPKCVQQTIAIEIHCRANMCHATLLKVWWNHFSHWNTLFSEHRFTRYKQGWKYKSFIIDKKHLTGVRRACCGLLPQPHQARRSRMPHNHVFRWEPHRSHVASHETQRWIKMV